MIGTMHFKLANFDAYTEEVSGAVADSLKDKIDDIVEESIETQVTPIVDRVVADAVDEQVPALVDTLVTEKASEIEENVDTKISELSGQVDTKLTEFSDQIDTKISEFSDSLDSKMDEIDSKVAEVDEKIAHIPTEEYIQGMIDTAIEDKPDTATVTEMINTAIDGIEPGITEERVREIVTGENQIAAAEGQFDDTKVYPNYSLFPGNELYSGSEEPREDVLYIDQSTGYQYTWDPAEEKYIQLFGTISEDSIIQIFNH